MDTEEFRATWAQTWHNNLKPYLATNILVVLLAWVIGYAIGGYLLSVVLPVAILAALTLMHRWASRGHGLRLSPTGVEFLRRDGKHVRMRWPDVKGVVAINRKTNVVIAPWGAGRAAAQAGAEMFAAANSGPGITGRGEVLGHAEVARQAQAGPAWVPLAEPVEVNMNLVLIDRNWMTGRIGDWFRRYRPDLLPPRP
jgi:hypothetical protein